MGASEGKIGEYATIIQYFRSVAYSTNVGFSSIASEAPLIEQDLTLYAQLTLLELFQKYKFEGY